MLRAEDEAAAPVPELVLEPPKLDCPVPVTVAVPEVCGVEGSQNEKDTITQRWDLGKKKKLTVDGTGKRSVG